MLQPVKNKENEKKVIEVMRDTDLLSLRKALTDKKVVSYFYRIRPGFRNRDTYSYCKLSFSRPLNEEDHLLILATKDITDVIRWGTERDFCSGHSCNRGGHGQ